MKKILIACALCVLLVSSAFAATYTLSGTDMSVSVDESEWYVFTRDNIKDNPELEELGVSYDYVYKTLYDNNAYMDAVLYYEDGDYIELFIRRAELEESFVANLSNRSDEDAEKFAKALADKLSVEDYGVYENSYKFARLDYKDSEVNVYVCEYATIVNRENYTLTFQSPSEFDEADREQIKRIVDSVHFEVDETLEEREPEESSFGSVVLRRTIAGAVGGGLVGGLIAWIGKRKKKKAAETAEDHTDLQ